MSFDFLSFLLGVVGGGFVAGGYFWTQGFLRGDAYGRTVILNKLSKTLKRPVAEGEFAPGGADELDQLKRMVKKGAKFAHAPETAE